MTSGSHGLAPLASRYRRPMQNICKKFKMGSAASDTFTVTAARTSMTLRIPC